MTAAHVAETRAFGYLVVSGTEPATMQKLGRLTIIESKTAAYKELLENTPADYAFVFVDAEGHKVAEVAAGYFPFFKKLIEQAAPAHSIACAEDTAVDIGPISILGG